MGSRYNSGNRVPTLMGLLQPPPPQSPIPEVEKDGRRLLILKKARRFKLGQRAVLGLGFSFLPREHQERREQRVSQAPRGSRWVLGGDVWSDAGLTLLLQGHTDTQIHRRCLKPFPSILMPGD